MVHTMRRAGRFRLVALAALAAVAGCDATGGGDAGAGPPSRAAAAPAGPGGASPSDDVARTIPASAFFRMPEQMHRERDEADGAEAVPELCDGELAPGDGVVASAAMMSLYQQPDDPEDAVPHGGLYQTIRSYGGDGAEAFMDRARDGLAGCRSYRTGETTVEVRTRPLAGVADEALTIDLVQPQRDLPGNPTGGEQTNRMVVMRFGTVVTVLNDTGYERSSSVPKLVDTFVDEAAKAIRAWRG